MSWALGGGQDAHDHPLKVTSSQFIMPNQTVCLAWSNSISDLDLMKGREQHRVDCSTLGDVGFAQ